MSVSIRNEICTAMAEICAEQDVVLTCGLHDGLVLLESGLDSMGFAILVAELEARLGYDPFILIETPVYPRTFGEFVAFYESFADHGKLSDSP